MRKFLKQQSNDGLSLKSLHGALWSSLSPYVYLYTMAAEIKQQLTGKWKQYKRENYDAYLETTSKSI